MEVNSPLSCLVNTVQEKGYSVITRLHTRHNKMAWWNAETRRARGVPEHFWREAVHTAVFHLNRAPTSALDGETPY